MTGTGTQADPYIFTTYAEMEVCATEVGAYCKQGKDIDLNEERPEGITETLLMHCTELDGNGYEIRNAYFKDYGAIKTDMRFGTLKNFKLINFYNARTDSNKAGTIYHQYGEIKDLTISGFVLSPSKWGIFTPGRRGILGLSANLDGPGGGISGDGGGYSINLENATIKLNGGRLTSANLKNCRVIGKISEVWLIDNSSLYTPSAASIIDAEIETSLRGQSNQVAVLYNTDKIAPGATVSEYGFTGVTEEQLHDAAYLCGLGFPIGVD